MNLLLRMEELFEATRNEALRPSMSLYNQVIQVLNDVDSREDAFPCLSIVIECIHLLTLHWNRGNLLHSSEVFGLLQYTRGCSNSFSKDSCNGSEL